MEAPVAQTHIQYALAVQCGAAGIGNPFSQAENKAKNGAHTHTHIQQTTMVTPLSFYPFHSFVLRAIRRAAPTARIGRALIS